MKQLFTILAFLISLSVSSQTTVTASKGNFTSNLQLKSINVTEFQTDTLLRLPTKIPTSKAIFDFVNSRTAILTAAGPLFWSSNQIAIRQSFVDSIRNGNFGGTPTLQANVFRYVAGQLRLTDTLDGVSTPKLQFFSAKGGAFRVGTASTQWNVSDVGLSSFSANADNTASGDYSTSFGQANIASGTYSASIGGGGNISSNLYAFSTGVGTLASGFSSFTMGNGTIASGLVSFSAGLNTRGIGTYSATFGDGTVARHRNHFVVGRFNDTSGITTNDTTRLFEVGSGITNGLSRSTAFLVSITGTTINTGLKYVDGNQGLNKVLTSDANGNATWQTSSSSGSGTVSSGAANRLAYYASSGTTVSNLAAITANRALVSDANGLPIAATTTATEIGYVNGVTSAIQTQLNGKQATLTNPVTGTGTSGQITYWNGTSTVTSSSNLLWDNTNGRLGISGTPLSKIHTVGYTTNLYSIRAGDFIIQPLSASNAIFGNNIYYNGSNDVLLSTGYGAAVQLFNGQIILQATNTGSSGATATYNRFLKGDYIGNVAIGGNIASGLSGFTGAIVYIDNNTSSLNVGTQTTVASAVVQFSSTTKGFLGPIQTKTQRDAIVSPTQGLEIFNSTSKTLDYHNGTSWQSLPVSANFTASGTGAATSIVIPHGFPGMSGTSLVWITAKNAASKGWDYATIDATNVTIVYTIAPASGTNNLSFDIQAKP